MNKAELIANISEKTGFNKKEAELSLNAFIECVSEALEKGDKIQLIGFGTFEAKERKAREGINPKKPGEKISIPASKTASFKVGKALKDRLNK